MLRFLVATWRAKGTESYSVPLIKDSDEDSGDLHLRMPDIPDIPESWGLIIGDALHNFRSALDAAWWQLAIAHLGRKPPEDEAGKVQFPLSKPGGGFDFGTARKWVGEAAAKFAEEVQPDHDGIAEPSRCRLRPSASLQRGQASEGQSRGPNPWRLQHRRDLARDPLAGRRESMSLPGSTAYPAPEGGPKKATRCSLSPADSWIRRPDVHFDAFQAAYISVDGKSDVLYLLGLIGELVNLVIDAAGGILEGRTVEIVGRERVDTDHIPRLEAAPGAVREWHDIPEEPGPLRPPTEDPPDENA